MEKLSRGQIRKLIRDASEACGSQRRFAKTVGVTENYISDILAGRKRAGPKVLKALGLRRSTHVTAI